MFGRKLSVMAAAVILVALAPAAPETDGFQKPVQEFEFHIDGGPRPPYSLDELWSQSKIVVEGTVVAEHPADLVIPNSTPPRAVVFTDYETEILEVFKSDGTITRTSKRVIVHRKGGSRDRGDYVERHVEKGVENLRAGRRYIFFLEPLGNGKYAVAGAPGEGIYWVRGEAVSPSGRSDTANVMAATPTTTLRDLLGGAG